MSHNQVWWFNRAHRVATVLALACLIGLVCAPLAAGQPHADSTATGARSGWSLAAIPAFFRTPDTGFGGGGGLILSHRPGEAGKISPASRPNTIPVLLLYSQRKQTIALLSPEFYFDDENWRLATVIGYGNFPNTIYGIGNDTPEEAEEDYTIEYAFLMPTLARRIYTSLSLGAALDFPHPAAACESRVRSWMPWAIRPR